MAGEAVLRQEDRREHPKKAKKAEGEEDKGEELEISPERLGRLGRSRWR